MPTFSTPGPVHLSVEASGGDVRVVARDRLDAVVTVVPRTADKEADRRAADHVQVDLSGDVLTVKGLKSWRQISPFGRNGLADITVEVPTGSNVSATTAIGKVVIEGDPARVNAKSAMGDITIDRMASGRAKTALGDVRIERVDGDLEVSTASGDVRVGTVRGSLTVKNSNGTTAVGHVAGDLKVKAANGRIDVDRVDHSTVCKTANGTMRVGRVGEGDVLLAAAAGGMEIGIPEGTAAWLDLNSQYGQVHNELAPADGPGAAERTVKVTAKTYSGDIVVRRSAATGAADEPVGG